MRHWLRRFLDWFRKPLPPLPPAPTPAEEPSALPLVALQKLVLHDEVLNTLFQDFFEHRRSSRGQEEIGWILLGRRDSDAVVVQACLPAGTHREAGIAHVRFHSDAQAIATRLLRTQEKKLLIVGVVHTHPGSLRHPSEGDLHGDRLWILRLRGKQGVFGIGTADVRPGESPRPDQRIRDSLLFSWFSLAEGDAQYRPLPLETVPGPDLARPLMRVWPIVEEHAAGLENLIAQLSRVQLALSPLSEGPGLVVTIPLAGPGGMLRLLLRMDVVRYYVIQGHDIGAVDPKEPALDRAVYLILAELARRRPAASGL